MGSKAKLPTKYLPSVATPTIDGYVCSCCGKPYLKQSQSFPYLHSVLYVGNNNYATVCYECINRLYTETTEKLQSEEAACRRLCMMLDMYYNPTMFDAASKAKNSSGKMTAYLGMASLAQYRGKTYADTLLEESLRSGRGIDESGAERPVVWSDADKQNQAYAIATVGYDPFEDCGMTEADRKYCFNILAGYCDLEGLSEDGHKIQSVIQITQSQLQCKKIDEIINRELLIDRPDEDKIKSLTATKKQLLDSITKIAQDNNISSAYNSASKQGISTLSSKMREMMQIGFDKVEVNLFDIKTCDAMRQIADLSNASIMEQLGLDSNDYTEMLREQRELLTKSQEETAKLKEENRKLQNELMAKGVL